jgi:hypothetical protein
MQVHEERKDSVGHSHEQTVEEYPPKQEQSQDHVSVS